MGEAMNGMPIRTMDAEKVDVERMGVDNFPESAVPPTFGWSEPDEEETWVRSRQGSATIWRQPEPERAKFAHSVQRLGREGDGDVQLGIWRLYGVETVPDRACTWIFQ